MAGLSLLLLAGCAGKTDPAESQDPLVMCEPLLGTPHYFRKSVLVTGTKLAPESSGDLPGLADLTSLRLKTHLDKLDRFRVIVKPQEHIWTEAPHVQKTVRRLGHKHSSQFIVKVEIQDLTILSPGNWLPNFMGGSGERNLRIQLFVFDSENGSVFHSKRYETTVSGDVIGYPGDGRRVPEAWFETDLGEAVDDMLHQAAAAVHEKLACIPFSTDVLSVNGNEIDINAGRAHGIRPGVTLRVYQRKTVWGQVGTLIEQTQSGWVRVKKVFPDHAIAVAVDQGGRKTRVSAGDVVRAW